MKYSQIVQIAPPGNPHAACLDHVARAFAGASGLPRVIVPTPRVVENAVVIGAHLMLLDKGYRNCAIWNTEQVFKGSKWMHPDYLAILAENEAWDYDQCNIESLARDFGIEAEWVPLGYHKSMERPGIIGGRVPMRPLFYGSMHPRREQVAKDCGARRLGICYGSDLDAEIRRARVVLNIHYYEAAIFEQVRCSYLFANAVPVLSEDSRGEFWRDALPEGTFKPYGELARAVITGEIPDGEAQREAYKKLPLDKILANVL